MAEIGVEDSAPVVEVLGVEWRVEAGEIRGRRLLAQKPKEAFPPGSLLKFFNPRRDKEELAILSGCAKGPK